MNEAMAAGLVANLLALPRTMNDAAAAADRDRMLLQAAGPSLGLTPEQVAQFTPASPGQFPGTNVPVLGSVLRGVGTAGRLLQHVVGTAPAPRPPMEELLQIATLRGNQQYRDETLADAEERLRLSRERAADYRARTAAGSGIGKAPWIFGDLAGDPTGPSKARAIRDRWGLPAATRQYLVGEEVVTQPEVNTAIGQVRGEKGATAAVTGRAGAKGRELGKLEAQQEIVGQPMLDQIDRMLDATLILPSGQDLAALGGSYTGTLGIRSRLKLRRFAGKDTEELRTLRAGALLSQQMFRLVAVGVATEQDVAPYRERLSDLEGQTREEAQNHLLEARDFIANRLGIGGAPRQDSSLAAPGEGPSAADVDEARRVFGGP